MAKIKTNTQNKCMWCTQADRCPFVSNNRINTFLACPKEKVKAGYTAMKMTEAGKETLRWYYYN